MTARNDASCTVFVREVVETPDDIEAVGLLTPRPGICPLVGMEMHCGAAWHGDIRGKGLMIGIELVKDQKTKAPFEPEAKVKMKITELALEEGLVLYPGGGSVDGVRGDHILLAPPLTITENEIDLVFERLEKAIQRAVASVAK